MSLKVGSDGLNLEGGVIEAIKPRTFNSSYWMVPPSHHLDDKRASAPTILVVVGT
jgi:hypothetical protein